MNFFQPFDQVGYFPSYFMHSKIISYKNLLLYNLYKETKITPEQMQNYYNNGGEGDFYNKSLAERYWNVFYEYFKKRMFSVDLEVLVGYSCETENGPVTLRHLYKILTNFKNRYTMADDLFNRLMEDIRKVQFTLINDFNNPDFDEIYNNNIKELAAVPSTFRDTTTGEAPSSYQVTLLKAFYAEYQRWFNDLRDILRKWRREFMNVPWNYMNESWHILNYFAINLDSERKYVNRDELYDLVKFKDYLIDYEIEDSIRKSYFQQNRNNIKIFMAIIGGKTILDWYGEIALKLKRPEEKTQEQVNEIGRVWLEFAVSCGYESSQEIQNYIETMIRTNLTYIEALVKQEYQAENNRLKNEIDVLKAEIEKQNEMLSDAAAQYDEINSNLGQWVMEREQLQNNYNELQNTNVNLLNEKSELEKQIGTNQLILQNSQSEVERLNNLLATGEQQYKDLSIQEGILRKQNELLVNRKDELQRNNVVLTEKIENLKNEKTDIANKVVNLNAKIKVKEDKIIELSERIEQLQKDKDSLLALNNNLKVQFDEAVKQGSIATAERIKGKIIEAGKNTCPFDYNENKSVEENLKLFAEKAKEQIDLKQQKIDDYAGERDKYVQQWNQLQQEKKQLLERKKEIEEEIEKNQKIKDYNEGVVTKYETVLNEITEKQNNIAEEKVIIAKQREEIENKIKEQEDKNKKAEAIIQEQQRLIEENEEKTKQINLKIKKTEEEKAKIEEEKKKIEKRKNEIEDTLAEKRKTIVKLEQDLKTKEEAYKKRVDGLDKREKDLQKFADTLYEGVIPKGVDAIENRIIGIIYQMPMNFEMNIKTFREKFIDLLKYMRNPSFTLPDAKNNESNTEFIYTRTIYGWFEFYRQRLANISERDFNPEGIINEAVRNIENTRVGDFLVKLWDGNILKNKTEFKKDIIENGIEDEQQKAYFIKRLTNAKIGEAIIGNKTIDGWYTLYLQSFFGGRNEYEEKDF